ncbi:MAG: phosphoribosylanthranilate isomerase [Gemmataceae bacterium]|nr:phosphoribosylanthranilate isomerase [Gemmataceae bacterium]
MIVKICGVTSVADALAAAESGADLIGLNFFERSPRCVAAATAAAIVAALPASVRAVGVSVQEDWDIIAQRARRLKLALVQVHGDQLEPCPYPDLAWIPAFAIRDAASLRAVEAFLERCPADRLPTAILVDAYVAGAYGGTGRPAPWPLLADWRPSVPVLLAGGLNADNVAAAVAMVRPWGVDVASGVEVRPGVKALDKMQRFVAAARAAACRC